MTVKDGPVDKVLEGSHPQAASHFVVHLQIVVVNQIRSVAKRLGSQHLVFFWQQMLTSVGSLLSGRFAIIADPSLPVSFLGQ